MKPSQSKDTIVKIILVALLYFIGEGIFDWGGYLIFLLLLPAERAFVYWYAMFLGLMAATLSSGVIGLASVVLILAVFIYSRIGVARRSNPLVLWVFAAGTNFILDLVNHSHWSYGEILASGVLVFILAASGYLKEEASIRV